MQTVLGCRVASTADRLQPQLPATPTKRAPASQCQARRPTFAVFGMEALELPRRARNGVLVTRLAIGHGPGINHLRVAIVSPGLAGERAVANVLEDPRQAIW